MLTCEQFNQMLGSGEMPHESSTTMRDAMAHHFKTCKKCRMQLESDVKEIRAKPVSFETALRREIIGARAAALGQADERRRKTEMN